MSKDKTDMTAGIEQYIKNNLAERGFPSTTITNNRGLIGATIEDTLSYIQHLNKNETDGSMTEKEMKYHTREMVKYLLDEKAAKDDEIVDAYTSTMVNISEQYAQHKQQENQPKFVSDEEIDEKVASAFSNKIPPTVKDAADYCSIIAKWTRDLIFNGEKPSEESGQVDLEEELIAFYEHCNEFLPVTIDPMEVVQRYLNSKKQKEE
jgi:hypothetical protein